MPAASVVVPSHFPHRLGRFTRITSCAALAGLLLVATDAGELAGQPPAKAEGLPPLNQTVVDEAVGRGVEYLRAVQQPVGIWGEGDGKEVGPGGKWAVAYTALAGLALVESGVRPSDTAIQRAARVVRAGAPHLVDTYEIALAILFLDRIKAKGDDRLIKTLAARLMAGQTLTGGWAYKVPKTSDADADVMLAALHRITPPPPTISVSYRERPAAMGLCIKSSDDVIIKPSQAALDAAALEKKRQAVVDRLPANLRKLAVFQDPEKLDKLDPEEKREVIEKEKGDNSNTHFATIGLWAARRHGVATERSFTLLARRFRTSQDAGGGGWGYGYPQSGSAPAMTCVALLGIAIGHALGVDPAAAGRPELDPAILKALKMLSKHVGAPTGKFADRPKVKDAGGLYYLWALERIAVLYDIPALDNKDWYRWGAEILIANQLTDGSWKDAMAHGDHPVVDTALAVLFLKRANLTPDLSKRLILDTTALTAKVNVEPKPSPPPAPQSPPTPKIDLSALFSAPAGPKETPTVTPPAPTTAPRPPAPTTAATESEPPAPKKESKPIWPWLVGGSGVLAMGGVGLVFALRKKPAEKPKKKGKKGGKATKKPKPAKPTDDEDE